MGDTTPSFTAKVFYQSLPILTIAVILMMLFGGAIGQATNNGSDCPDWLLCYGQALPPAQVTTWLNFAHLALAGLAALLTGVTIIISARCGSAGGAVQSRRFMTGLAGLAGLAFAQVAVVLILIGAPHSLAAKIGYLIVSMGHLAGVVAVATVGRRSPAEINQPLRSLSVAHTAYLRLIVATGVALFLVVLNGALVTARHAAAACPDWPLCQGQFLPALLDSGVLIHLLHRFSVVAAGIVVAALVLQTCRTYARQPGLVRWAAVLGLLFLAQIGVGGWSAFSPVSPVLINAIHLILTISIWASLVVLTTTLYLVAPTWPASAEAPVSPPRLTFRQKAGVYFKLTKPWIMILLLITTAGAMVIAAKGLPSFGLIVFTLLGGALSAGGASVLNSYVDSDIDQLMSRTSRRATVTGLVTPTETLIFGLVLSTLSFFVYALFVNTLSAALSTLGILYYVFFYTLYLKRSTIHNIIIGGAAGAIPPLVGWTAVTGRLDLGALYLFAIIFFWTPPHTWALALMVKKDYAQARVPMLPVVVGEKETTYQIFLYSILLITLTLLPFTFYMQSMFYLIAALALGLPFIYLAWKLWRDYNKSYSKRLYKFSQLYLALLFIVMAIDRSFFVS